MIARERTLDEIDDDLWLLERKVRFLSVMLISIVISIIVISFILELFILPYIASLLT